MDQQGKTINRVVFLEFEDESLYSGGKTVILNTLAEAQTQMGMKTNLYILNPKAINVNELYGTLDPLTRNSIRIKTKRTNEMNFRRMD